MYQINMDDFLSLKSFVVNMIQDKMEASTESLYNNAVLMAANFFPPTLNFSRITKVGLNYNVELGP